MSIRFELCKQRSGRPHWLAAGLRLQRVYTGHPDNRGVLSDSTLALLSGWTEEISIYYRLNRSR